MGRGEAGGSGKFGLHLQVGGFAVAKRGTQLIGAILLVDDEGCLHRGILLWSDEGRQSAQAELAHEEAVSDRLFGQFLQHLYVAYSGCDAGMAELEKLYAAASGAVRTQIPVSELKIGLKCGGSDGFSGITANPLVGRVSDLVIAQGGTSVLTEVPEMFGAETLLMNRCVDRTIFEKCVAMINGFKDYFVSVVPAGTSIGTSPR